MFDVAMERCADTFQAAYPPTATIRSAANPRAHGNEDDRAGATGGKRCSIHSPGSKLGRTGSFCAASAGSGAGFRSAMIVALRERGGVIGLRLSGMSAATD